MLVRLIEKGTVVAWKMIREDPREPFCTSVISLYDFFFLRILFFHTALIRRT